MKVLITGSAGFIGSALSLRLLDRGDEVVGIDNHNDYYDPELKEARLNRHLSHQNYKHIRMDIENKEIDYEREIDFRRLKNSRKQIDNNYRIMKQFLKQLP